MRCATVTKPGSRERRAQASQVAEQGDALGAAQREHRPQLLDQQVGAVEGVLWRAMAARRAPGAVEAARLPEGEHRFGSRRRFWTFTACGFEYITNAVPSQANHRSTTCGQEQAAQTRADILAAAARPDLGLACSTIVWSSIDHLLCAGPWDGGFGWGLSGLDDPESSVRSRTCQALVVGHEGPEVRAELLGAGEVDGVQRSEIGRRQQSGRIQDAIVDPQEVHPREHLHAPPNNVRSEGQERADDLGPGKGTRHERPSATEVSPQYLRFGFSNG